MKIAFTYNLKKENSEDQAEFDTPETIETLTNIISSLGHEVEPIEVSGPPSLSISRIEALNPDLVFNTAEGKFGKYREAFYPSIFEQLGVPFTGADAYACTLTLDKFLTKKVVMDFNIPTPKSALITQTKEVNKIDLKFPVIIKPNFEGSSKGISDDSIAETPEELKTKMEQLLTRYPLGLLVEEYIEGKDVTIGYINGLNPKQGGVLVPTEYIISEEYNRNRKYNIYDYKLKNTEYNHVTVKCPADISDDVYKKIVQYARDAFKATGVVDFARADFRVTSKGEVYFIEINCLPSLEPGAGIYAAAEYLGVGGVDKVLGAIINSARKRYNIKAGDKKKKPSTSKLRVGFTYNEKRIIPHSGNGDSPMTDREAEFDSPKTLNAIREAIASYGHEVIDLEATSNLPAKLIDANVDFCFNIAEGIVGRYRESQVPAILELMNVEYTGSDAATLALTLDKGLAKRIVADNGIKTPRFITLFTGKEAIPKDFVYPLMVKPVAEGSSKGIARKSVCFTEEELRNEVKDIINRYRQGALAEEFLTGREFTVALIGEKKPKVLPPMEIVFTEKAGEFPIYHFQHKLEFNEEVRYEVPANVDEKLLKKITTCAKKVFQALNCRDVSRIDLRLDAQGEVNFIECNPLPGLTPGWSDLCMIAEKSNLDYRTLIGEIMAPAIKRLKIKRKELLKTDEPRPKDEGFTILANE